MLIVDADGHVTGDTLSTLRERLPGRHRLRERLLPNDGWDRELGGVLGKNPSDLAAHLADLDREGIDVQILYPTGCLGIGRAQDVEAAGLLATAYNDWLAEYCAQRPERLKGVAVVALQDVDAATRELERVARQHGMVGVMISTFNWPGVDLGSPLLDPFYATAERLDLAVAYHIVVGPGCVGDNRFDNFSAVHVNVPVFEMATTLTQVVLGGVLERFPRLRVAFLEAGVGWLPCWFERLDEHYELRHVELTRIRQKPSEYLKNGRCYFSFEPEESLLPHVVRLLGDRVLMYNSDYPHWDSSFPNTVRTVLERADLAPEVSERLMGLNALQLYGLRAPEGVGAPSTPAGTVSA